MIHMADMTDREAEQYRIKANRILSMTSLVATLRMAELLATIDMLDDSLTTLRNELRDMKGVAADNNEMIWRLKGQVADLQKNSS